MKEDVAARGIVAVLRNKLRFKKQNNIICTTYIRYIGLANNNSSLNKNVTSHFVSCVEQIAVIECININFPPDFTNLLDKMQ